jgi:hypothetical protein
VVARFHGKVWSVVEKGKSVVKKPDTEEMDVWGMLAKRKDLMNMQDEPY